MSQLERPLVKDMAITPEEFQRLLPRALDGWDYRQDGALVQVGSPDLGLTITLSSLPPRRLGGLLELQRCQVELAFRGLDGAAREAFLRQFDQAYQRGGG